MYELNEAAINNLSLLERNRFPVDITTCSNTTGGSE